MYTLSDADKNNLHNQVLQGSADFKASRAHAFATQSGQSDGSTTRPFQGAVPRRVYSAHTFYSHLLVVLRKMGI